jgi:hypothetical protein
MMGGHADDCQVVRWAVNSYTLLGNGALRVCSNSLSKSVAYSVIASLALEGHLIILLNYPLVSTIPIVCRLVVIRLPYKPEIGL